MFAITLPNAVECPLRAAVCHGGALDPIALSGYYRLSRSVFVACTPPEACLETALPSPAERAALTATAFGGVRARLCAALGALGMSI